MQRKKSRLTRMTKPRLVLGRVDWVGQQFWLKWTRWHETEDLCCESWVLDLRHSFTNMDCRIKPRVHNSCLHWCKWEIRTPQGTDVMIKQSLIPTALRIALFNASVTKIARVRNQNLFPVSTEPSRCHAWKNYFILDR